MFDTIPERSKFPDHLGGASLRPMLRHRWPAFVIRDAVVEDLPDQATEPMRNRTDRLRVSEPDDQTPIHELKDTAFGLHRRIGGLIQEAPQLSIAVR